MLHVWMVSGRKLAAMAPQASKKSDVKSLKEHLRNLHNFPVCLQQVLHDGKCLEDFMILDVKMDLQLVLLTALSTLQQQHAGAKELLQYAASEGHVEVARLLLQAGVPKDLHFPDVVGDETALSLASFKGHVELVRLLLETHADTEVRAGQGRFTAIVSACFNGHVEVARLLLEAGRPRMHTRASILYATLALQVASAMGHIQLVRLLLQARAQLILWQNLIGESALIYACDAGHLEVAELLLQAGANVNMQDNHGDTALMLASEKGHVKIVERLLAAGADLDCQDKDGDTALILACAENICRLLSCWWTLVLQRIGRARAATQPLFMHLTREMLR